VKNGNNSQGRDPGDADPGDPDVLVCFDNFQGGHLNASTGCDEDACAAARNTHCTGLNGVWWGLCTS
jgi:hypothetical protein